LVVAPLVPSRGNAEAAGFRSAEKRVGLGEEASMAIVEIESVQTAAAEQERIRGFAIDAPMVGGRDVYDIEFAGWVIGGPSAATGVEIHAEGTVLRRAPLDQFRQDVERAFPDEANARLSGFRTWVSVVGLEPGVALQLRAVLADGSRVRLATVRFSRQPVATGFSPTLRPLMLTTMGRAGTTWTMRLLSEHPQIVIHRWHPYELRTARYWWHSFKVLSEPRDPHNSAQADRFQTNREMVGHNPFYPEPIAVTPGLGEWMGRGYVERLGNFYQGIAEETYRRIAAGQGQSDPVYFAEKHRADALPWLVWELYPGRRNCSWSAISAMSSARCSRSTSSRGSAPSVPSTSPATRSSPATSEHHDQAACPLLAEAARPRPPDPLRRADDRHRPGRPGCAPLPRAGRLPVDHRRHGRPGIGGERELAAAQDERRFGRLAGRWRESLSPSVQAVCNEVFADVLQQFGYDI
jgi:hypothetical protein